MTAPSTGSPDSAAASMRRHAFSKRDLVERVGRLTNRQLVGEDDPLRLVADVDKHFVLVDADDFARHNVALVEWDEGCVVVGDNLPVDL